VLACSKASPERFLEMPKSKKLLRACLKTNQTKPIHKRWIVERTFWWFDNNRHGVAINNY
jgi:hypothetical protein